VRFTCLLVVLVSQEGARLTIAGIESLRRIHDEQFNRGDLCLKGRSAPVI
jgi:hypothetical protein